ncbi:MAG TPA: hypothetical protein VN642_05390 [Dongiaceae bacterium]|nr:hypothetical protein [Dongiaceae bacterium]
MRLSVSVVAVIVLSGLIGGCGGSGGGGDQTATTISGIASKGPLKSATVTVYAINADGSIGAVLGSGTTSSNSSNTGTFSVTLNSKPGAYVLVNVSNGTYVSEFDGTNISNGSNMTAILDGSKIGSGQIAITPLSDMVVQRADTLLDEGKDISSAIAQARQEVQALYGLTTHPESTIPSFDSSNITSEAYKMGLALVSLDTFAHQVSATSSDATFDKLVADFADGKLDGKMGGVAVQYGTLASVDATTLKSMMFSATQTSVTAVANGVSPKSIKTWANANPVEAASVVAPAPGYSCIAGYQLVNSSSGSATCWDGTKTGSGTPLIGSYAVCSADGTKVADESQCPATGGFNTCSAGYQLINNGSTCWDGTTTATGTPLVGPYYVCAANNAKVALSSQCPATTGINLSLNSTQIALFHAPLVNRVTNSTTIATYTAPAVTAIQQAAAVKPINSSVLSAIKAGDTSTLPSYVTPPSGGLTQAQVDAYASMNQLMTNFFSH